MEKQMDPKLVAVKEASQGEMRYIASTYKIPIKYVRLAASVANKGDKPSRSRARIYKKLREMGFVIELKKPGKKSQS